MVFTGLTQSVRTYILNLTILTEDFISQTVVTGLVSGRVNIQIQPIPQHCPTLKKIKTIQLTFEKSTQKIPEKAEKRKLTGWLTGTSSSEISIQPDRERECRGHPI